MSVQRQLCAAFAGVLPINANDADAAASDAARMN
jgi:hypothetical protein